MRSVGSGSLALSLFLVGSAAFAVPDDFERILAFEGAHRNGAPAGWQASPANTVRVDDRHVHGGKWSVLIERDARSERRFSTLSRSLAVRFRGERIQLRGFLRTEAVTSFAGLLLRQEGDQGTLALDNMRHRNLRGDTEWTPYEITMALRPGARRLVFGALLCGEGKAWVDDLELLIDGKPVAKAVADDGSGIAVTELTPAQVRNLTLLGKVWGFLKYHHPAITAGKRDWDHELFRVLPRLLEAEDQAAGNAVLLAWCKDLGPAPANGPSAAPPQDVHLRPALDWIRDERALGEGLGAWLQAVHRNRHGGGAQRYVSLVPGVGNPRFDREKPYAYFACPDAGYRILALYRLWNIIAYWFPYRDLIGEDWDGVLAEFLPRLVGATSADAYRLELMALIARVHDTHANLWSSLDVRPPRGSSFLPVLARFVDGRAVVVGSTLKGAPPEGLKVGDVILALDGRPIEQLIETWAPYYAASNRETRLRDIGRSLTRGDPGPCRVRIERDGKTMELTLERVPADRIDRRAGRFYDRPGETFQRLSPEVAYLKLSSVTSDVGAYVRAAQGTKGLVIDIRNYPSRLVVLSLGSMLVREPTPFARFTTGDLANPGAFTWSKPLVLTPAKPHYEGRVVILVDEVSQSQAEYSAMAFRVAPDAVVVGSTTAGADGNVSPIPLPGGLRAMISGIGIFYPDKTPTQRVGIVPDVRVRPTPDGIRAGRDEVLEEALRQILGDSAPEEEIMRMARR